MAHAKLLLVCALTIFYLEEAYGHGMLMEPVNRGSAWRKGFNTPRNYDDSGNYCGGLFVHRRNGECGLCGDDYSLPTPRPNENGGKYGTGTIVRTYKAGDQIELVSRITTNHRGHVQFFICPLSNNNGVETEECFAKYPLKLSNGSYKYVLPSHESKDYTVTGILPPGLTCEHCVLRWEYVAGNNWGKCEDGTSKMGCGPQETFKTCSDIRIAA